jgi:thiol-disulfide isomerase/thioredoxin
MLLLRDLHNRFKLKFIIFSAIFLTGCFGSAKERVDGGAFHEYSSEIVDNISNDQNILLFFTGPNCNECNRLLDVFINNPDKIPDDLVVLEINLEEKKDLQDKYNVYYKNSFVLLNSGKEEIKRWSGGGFKEMIDQLSS